jgi:non-specific serine/threonine protein kinase
VFLISLKAGGIGLNLTAADYVYIVDPWWNPAVEQQAIDRTHRIGQTKNIFAYRLICKDTLEEKMLQLQERKRSLANELVSDDNAFMKRLTKDDIAFLFS